MRKRKRAVRCAFCNRPLKEVWRADEPVCALCEAKGRRWSEELPQPPVPIARGDEDDGEDEDNRDELEASSRRSTARHVPFLIGLGLVLIVWIALVAISFALPIAAYALSAVGAVVFFIGMAQLFHSAAEDGISLSAYVSRNPLILVILFFIQAAAAPVFSLVYLFINFEDAWKPALLQLAGIGMTGSGIVLLRYVL